MAISAVRSISIANSQVEPHAGALVDKPLHISGMMTIALQVKRLDSPSGQGLDGCSWLQPTITALLQHCIVTTMATTLLQC